MRADRVAGALLLAGAAGVAWEARVLPFGTLAAPGPGYAPMVLAAALAVFSLLILAAGGRSPPLAALGWSEARHAAAALASCAFAALFLEALGYRLAILLISFFLLAIMERVRWPVAVVISLGLSLGTWFLFADLLKVPLPRGSWEF
jgi:putative tricarboxylic transport membrane protein